LIKFRAELSDQVGFALGEVLLQPALPFVEPWLEIGFDRVPCFLGRLAATACDGLDLLGESARLVRLPGFLGVEALAQLLDLECLLALDVGDAGVQSRLGHRHGPEILLKAGETLLEGMKLPSDNDLADFFDLLGRGGCG
jgi:hypothetical protein